MSVRMTHPDTGGSYDAQPSQVPHLKEAGWRVATDQDEQGEEWPAELRRFEGQDQVTIRHPETGGESVVAASAVPYHREKGWEVVEAEGPPPASEDERLEALTVVELRELAKEQGISPLPTTKADLVAALSNPPAEDQAGGEPAPTEEGEA